MNLQRDHIFGGLPASRNPQSPQRRSVRAIAALHDVTSHSHIKSAIVRAVVEAGDRGITTAALMKRIFRGPRQPNESVVKAHVWQINAALRETGSPCRIISEMDATRHRVWVLMRRVRLHPSTSAQEAAE